MVKKVKGVVKLIRGSQRLLERNTERVYDNVIGL